MFVSILGSFLCKFVSLRELRSNQDVYIGIWLRTKLYYVEDEQDGTWDVLKGCGSYSGDVNFDSLWNSAKAFSIMASVIGSITIIFVMFVSCLPITESRWKVLGALLLLTCLFQGLTLLFLSSDAACGSGDRTLYTDLGTLEFADGCGLASGANMCIAATVLWFLAGALVCVIPCPNLEEFEDPPEKDQRVPAVDSPPDAETPAQQDQPAEEPAAAETSAGGDGETP